MDLKELKNKIEEIEITYDYEESYTNLWNTCIKYMKKTQDFDFEYLFEEFETLESVEQMAKYELENYGLTRLRYFLGDINFNMGNLFKINGYGNVTNIQKYDLELLKREILDIIKDKMEEEEY